MSAETPVPQPASRWRWLAAWTAALVLSAAGAGLLVWSRLEKPVLLVVDGAAEWRLTRAANVAGLLAEAGLALDAADSLMPAVGETLSAGSVVRLERAAHIVIWADGEQTWLYSPPRLAGNLLSAAGVALYPGDQVWIDGVLSSPAERLAAGRAHSLQVRRAVSVQVRGAAGVSTLTTTSATLASALAEAGVTIQAADVISPALELSPAAAPVVDYHPARPVTITSQAGEVRLQTAALRVGQALQQAGLAAQYLDYTDPPLDAALPADGQIRLVRVSESVQVEQTPLPFQTTYQSDAAQPLDSQQIVEVGAYGVQARRVRTRYEDGVEVRRVVEAEWLAQPPVDRVVSVGTLVTPLTADTADGTITYWRSVQMFATSYSPCRLGIPNYCNSVTASGRALAKGVVALTRPMYSWLAGRQVYIPGYGFAVVADIGAGVGGQAWIDLGYSDADWVSWSRTVTVYFLWPPPANPSLLLP